MLADGAKAFVSRYALGRDYHKVLRDRLQKLSDRIAAEVGEFGYRVFTDSAPVMEVELAARAGLGWRGKHTLLLSREAGSCFFLGEIYTDLPLPVDAPVERALRHLRDVHRGLPDQRDRRARTSSTRAAAFRISPSSTRARFRRSCAPLDRQPRLRLRRLPARLPVEPVRAADAASRTSACATASTTSTLVELFAWTEAEFDERLAGSAIRRIGYERWLRNLAVGLGNAPTSERVVAALRARADDPSALVREHVAWALSRHAAARISSSDPARTARPGTDSARRAAGRPRNHPARDQVRVRVVVDRRASRWDGSVARRKFVYTTSDRSRSP